MAIQQNLFDYSTLAVEVREFVKSKELSIKARTSQTVWENGRDLLEVKERLEHGQFMDWCKANIPWGKSTIANMMNVADKFPTGGSLDMPAKVLYLLAAPSTPDSAREEAMETENVTHQQAKEIIEAHKKISDLENQITDLESQLPTQDVLDKISNLSAQLQAEKDKPPEIEEIEVIPDDYEKTKDDLGKAKETLKKSKEKVKRLTNEQEALMKKLVPVEDIPEEDFNTIIIDPPWPVKKIHRDERPNQDVFSYPTMTVEEVMDFPADQFAAAKCHLFLWTTQKYLPHSMRIIKVWGFDYVFTMVWHKPGGFQPFNLPQYNCEFCLYGKKGAIKFLDTKNFPTCFDGARGKHSEKPEEFYDLIRRVTQSPRIDIFSREKRQGFDQYGNEKTKFQSRHSA